MKVSIRQLAFNENLLLGFEIISINSHDAQSKKNLRAPHRASFYSIIWFETGHPVHIVDFGPVTIKPNSFLFIRKDAVQFFDQSAVFTSRVVIFTDAFFCASENDHLLLQSSPLFNDLGSTEDSGNIPATAQMSKIWALIEEEAKQPANDFKSRLLKHHLSNFILLAERERQKAGHSQIRQGIHLDLFIAFRTQLETSFKTEKGVSYYAQKLFVSGKVLTHAVQLTTGKTPKQVIDEQVMLEAKRLLVHSRDPANMIALSLGFDEPTNFNKFFKKHAGKTPTEFRKTYTS